VVLKVVDKVLLPVLAQEVVLYLRRVRRPLKVEQGDCVGYFLPPHPLVHYSRNDWVVVALQQNVAVALGVDFLASHLSVFLLNLLLFVQLLKLIALMDIHWLPSITYMLELVGLRILVCLNSTLVRV